MEITGSYHPSDQADYLAAFVKRGQKQSVFGNLKVQEGKLPKKGQRLNDDGDVDETDVTEDDHILKKVTDVLEHELSDKNTVLARAAGNTSTFCEECDQDAPMLATSFCLDCRTKICLYHKELHKYSVKTVKHRYETVQKKVWDHSHIPKHQMCQWGTLDPMPLLLPRDSVVLRVMDRKGQTFLQELIPKDTAFASTSHCVFDYVHPVSRVLEVFRRTMTPK